MKYHIWTIGCQMNVSDSWRVASTLEAMGYEKSARIDDADVIVLNTCVVRQSAEDRASGRLNSLKPLKKRNPNLVINLMGCMVGVKESPHLRECFPFVDVFSPPSDPGPLLAYLAGRQTAMMETDIFEEPGSFSIVRPAHLLRPGAAAYVPVVYGCSHACSFCVIPYRRGIERSRPLEDVLKEIEILVSKGVKEVTLLGQIVDRYGKDLPGKVTLSTLLRALHPIPGLERLRFLTSHPNWMSDELLRTAADLPKVMPHIEVPVQSGDDEVLEAMRRGYSVSDYERLIERIRRAIPGAGIANDIIVGFPGESEAQFRHTYELVERLRLDVVHLARYSERPGTLAARQMPDDVSEEEKWRRFRLIEDLQEGISGEINAAYLNRDVEVLFEERIKGRWMGRTPANKIVFVESDEELYGRILPVTIRWSGPWSMRGELAGDGRHLKHGST